jgi:hypothetical protein
MDERFLSGLLAMALLMSTIMMSAIIIGVFIGIMYNVHASVSNAVTGDWCYDEGYRDGLAHPFNHITYDECGVYDHSDRYYEGFIGGCTRVEENTEDECHCATNPHPAEEKECQMWS